MEDALLYELCEEIRQDNQVPPYTDDEIIMRSIRRCAARLDSLRPGADFETDTIARGYLKDFVNYDMLHRGEEFLQNYRPDILAWQLSEESGVTGDEA